MVTHGHYSYQVGPERAWNNFDFFIVLFSMPGLDKLLGFPVRAAGHLSTGAPTSHTSDNCLPGGPPPTFPAHALGEAREENPSAPNDCYGLGGRHAVNWIHSDSPFDRLLSFRNHRYQAQELSRGNRLDANGILQE